MNDELAQRNLPAPVYNNWRDRVNDDLAACTAVEDPLVTPLKNSYKRKNENINVDHIFTINDSTTINTYTTMTNRNDALLPFASFSFLCKRIYQSIFGLVELSETRKLVPVRIPVIKKHLDRKEH